MSNTDINKRNTHSFVICCIHMHTWDVYHTIAYRTASSHEVVCCTYDAIWLFGRHIMNDMIWCHMILNDVCMWHVTLAAAHSSSQSVPSWQRGKKEQVKSMCAWLPEWDSNPWLPMSLMVPSPLDLQSYPILSVGWLASLMNVYKESHILLYHQKRSPWLSGSCSHLA